VDVACVKDGQRDVSSFSLRKKHGEIVAEAIVSN